MRRHVEVIDGQEFTVTRLSADKRLQPSKVKQRQLFQSLTGPEKNAHIRRRIANAKKRRRRTS